MSDQKIDGVLYLPQRDEIRNIDCSYLSKNPRLKIQRLLRSKILETNQKCLILKSFRLHPHTEQNSEQKQTITKKRNKTLQIEQTEAKKCKKSFNPISMKRIDRRYCPELLSIQDIKEKLANKSKKEFLFSNKCKEQKQEQEMLRIKSSMKKNKYKEKGLLKKNEREKYNISLNLHNLDPKNGLQKQGFSQNLRSILTKKQSMLHSREKTSNYFSFAEKKELLERKNQHMHIHLSPINAGNKKKEKKNVQFTPWEISEIKNESFYPFAN